MPVLVHLKGGVFVFTKERQGVESSSKRLKARDLLENDFKTRVEAIIELLRSEDRTQYCKNKGYWLLSLLKGENVFASLDNGKYSAIGVAKCKEIGVDVCKEFDFTIDEVEKILEERNWVKEYKKVGK